MADASKSAAHTRELTRLRVERYRKRAGLNKNDIDNASLVDLERLATDIDHHQCTSMQFETENDKTAVQSGINTFDLNISDEYLQLEESMRESWGENNEFSDRSESEADDDEHTVSDHEGNDFQCHGDTESTDEGLVKEEEELDEIEELRQWALNATSLTQTDLDGLLKWLGKYKYPNIPKTSKTFLKTTSAEYDIKTFDNKTDSEYVYFGLIEHLKRTINITMHPDREISLLIHVDGSSPYKSSNKQFWPILAKVFLQPDLYKVFPIALYSGVGKPKNIHQFFEGFVNEMNSLMDEGIIIGEQSFRVRIKAFICDRPARSFVKCVKNHGAVRACERCEVQGESVEGRTVYLSTEAADRTDESFRSQRDALHHNGVSPLTFINPTIDLVRHFVLDVMHLLWLGIMKKFLVDIWINGNRTTRFSFSQKSLFSSYLLMMKHQVPQEFQRSTASLADVSKWKATQFRFLALYSGPIILKKCLDENLYKHFLLFHVACRILSCRQLAITLNYQAKRFLRIFVKLCEQLYGKYTLVLNVHSLLHVADDALNLQCSLSEINAFPFESALGKIKNMLRTGYRPLSQICRRIHEQFFANTPKAELPSTFQILSQLRPDASGKIIVKKILFKSTILTRKSPDNTVLLRSGEIIEIENMYIASTEPRVMRISGKSLRIKKPMFEYPCDSTMLKMYCVSRRGRKEIDCKEGDLCHKMVTLDVSTDGKEEIFTMPLLHSSA